MTNALAMLQKALTEMGAQGLCNPDIECGCDLDDLAPCDSLNLQECKAAKKVLSEPDSEEMANYGLEYYQVVE
jgi:hypothetical protein